MVATASEGSGVDTDPLAGARLSAKASVPAANAALGLNRSNPNAPAQLAPAAIAVKAINMDVITTVRDGDRRGMDKDLLIGFLLGKTTHASQKNREVP